MRSIEIPQPEDRDWRYRLLEILPGALTYTILALPIILSIINPKAAAYFVITFLLVWFVRALAIAARSIQGWNRMNSYMKLPWQKLNNDLQMLQVSLKSAPKWHGRNLARVEKHLGPRRIKPSEVYHAIIVAFYNESRDVLEPTVQSVLASDYDPKKVILILAYEERGGPDTEALANELVSEYGRHFYHAQAVKHPGNIAGEVIGKGGNITYAGRQLQKYLASAKIAPEHVLVTTLDSDNRPDKQYLPALTTVVYGSFAAINSQTRLMFGWYLGFNVTEKAVKK